MWLIEQNVFPHDEESALISALTQSEIHHEILTPDEVRQREFTQAQIPRGSCYLLLRAMQNPTWRASLWGSRETFLVSQYGPRYGEHLLNADFQQMTFHELCWQAGQLEESLFIRPDDGFKSIEGQLVHQRDFDDWRTKAELLQLRGSTPLIVARPRPIDAEYRCLLVDGKVVASSQYRPVKSPETPTNVIDFATRMHHTIYAPCQCYALDIALTDNQPKVIELSPILCVAWYHANPLDALTAIQRMTTDD